MLAVLNKQKTLPLQERKVDDVIVTKIIEKEIYNEDGSKTIKRLEKKVNLTKKINETKRLLKTMTAQEKAEEIEKIYTQG